MEVKFTESEKHAYVVGSYRLWFDKEKEYLRMKLDQDEDLYTIPKDSKLYERLTMKYFSK